MSGAVHPLVTIAVPTYNRAETLLPETIGSVLRQTYGRFELIVSDNCSIDRTTDVVLSVSDPRLRYYRHSRNIGANTNFNFCLRQARGEYFLLLQDDDLIDPDFIEVCMDAVARQPGVGLVRAGTRIIDATGAVRREKPNLVEGGSLEEFFRGWFRGKTSLYLCSTLFNTEALRSVGGFQSRRQLFQDVMAELRVAARFGRLDIVDVKASFRKHPNEMTFAAGVGGWCEDSLELLDLMCRLASEDRELIRREGQSFFARLNYRRARRVAPGLGRLGAYLVVVRAFGVRHPPRLGHVYALLEGTALYRPSRWVKRNLVPGSRALAAKARSTRE